MLQTAEKWIAGWLRSDALVGAIGLFTLLIAAGLTVSFWRNDFSLETASRYVAFTSTESRTHNLDSLLPPGTTLILEGAKSPEWPPTLAGPAREGNISEGYRLDGQFQPASVMLRRIELEKGTDLAFRIRGNSLEISMMGKGLVEFNLVGPFSEVDGEVKPTVSQGEPLLLQLSPENEEIMRILISPAFDIESFEIADQGISELRFVPPVRPEQFEPGRRPIFLSEIVSGDLWLRDVDQWISLRRRALVWLQDPQGFKIEHMSVKKDALNVEASGVARRISTGPPDLNSLSGPSPHGERDVTPSIFTYLVGRHDLKLLWGFAIAALGLLWQARRWARGLTK